MKAGYSRAGITPPVGTTMMGFGDRDTAHGCIGIHDDIYVRALALEHAGEKALVMGFDLCFLGREDADRLKGAIGRVLDLAPRQILLNVSHNHAGPSVGTWHSAGYRVPDRPYLSHLERATAGAAREAFSRLTPVTLTAGVTRSRLPMNRRKRMDDGTIQNRPNPGKAAYDRLPIALLTGESGEPVCLLFSVSCHPSMITGWEVSGEYPCAAMRKLDEHFGSLCSLFLQGVGGDAKPMVIGRHGVDRWQAGTWELMDEAGALVAGEVLDALQSRLKPIGPDLRCATTEMVWPLQPAPSKAEFEATAKAMVEENREDDIGYLWAMDHAERLERGFELPTSVTLTAQEVTLGDGLRIFGVEGEAVGDWGYLIEPLYGDGVTFLLGYTNGQGLYLPTSAMVAEGGYEVTSAWEYGFPSNLATGMEAVMREAVEELRSRKIP